MDGQWLNVQINEQIVNGQIVNIPNSHHGSLEEPIILQMKKCENEEIRKLIEDDHVIIIRNGERYDVTGKKL